MLNFAASFSASPGHLHSSARRRSSARLRQHGHGPRIAERGVRKLVRLEYERSRSLSVCSAPGFIQCPDTASRSGRADVCQGRATCCRKRQFDGSVGPRFSRPHRVRLLVAQWQIQIDPVASTDEAAVPCLAGLETIDRTKRDASAFSKRRVLSAKTFCKSKTR